MTDDDVSINPHNNVAACLRMRFLRVRSAFVATVVHANNGSEQVSRYKHAITCCSFYRPDYL